MNYVTTRVVSMGGIKKKENLAERLLGIIFTILGAVFLAVALIVAVAVLPNVTGAEGENLYILPIVFGSIGTPFLLVGIGFLIFVGKMDAKKKALMQNGNLIYAEVTGGSEVFNVQVNGRHPWKLECRYEDPFSGEIYLYSSRNTFTDPYPYIGQQIAVYVDKNDPSKYYVDIQSLRQQENVYDFR